ncbi:MAG: hypothetical protein J0H68_02820 [Sphingobacteriia bacterium]|nr:hypothetical protein [Sphingobacteriia bacterium]
MFLLKPALSIILGCSIYSGIVEYIIQKREKKPEVSEYYKPKLYNKLKPIHAIIHSAISGGTALPTGIFLLKFLIIWTGQGLKAALNNINFIPIGVFNIIFHNRFGSYISRDIDKSVIQNKTFANALLIAFPLACSSSFLSMLAISKNFRETTSNIIKERVL